MLRIDVSVADTHPVRLPGAGRQPVRPRRPAGVAAGDLGVRPAQPVALQLRRSGARRHRRARHRRRRAEPVRRESTTSRRTAAAATTAGAIAKARTTTSRRCRPAYLPLIEPIHEYDHSVGQSITGGYRLPRHALPASFRGRYFFADFVQGRVLSIALDARRATARRAPRTWSSTPPSCRRPARSATSARSASMPTASCTSSATRSGRILKIIGPPAAPPVPTGLRIIR